jgi:hypothetical protein
MPFGGGGGYENLEEEKVKNVREKGPKRKDEGKIESKKLNVKYVNQF